ncbi:MAG: hypothetical protein ABWY20_15840, partial [Mycobacterium sp.]
MLGKAAFDSASELQQQAGAVDAVFGAGAAQMHKFAADAAQTVGLAASEYDKLAAVLGSQLTNAGFAGDKLNGTVDGLVQKGADLAAQFGGSTAEAVEALSSVLKGETDPIERYGVSIKQSDISARLAAQGQDKLTGAALKNAQAVAALDLVTEQTANSTGAFSREADTAAGAQQRLGAWWENTKAAIGERLLPIFEKLTTFMSEKVAPIIDKLVEKGGPLTTAFETIGSFITDKVIPAVSSLWDWLEPKLMPIFESISSIITDVLVPAFEKIWDIIQTYVVPIIRDTLGPVLDGIKTYFDKLRDALVDNKDKFEAIYEKVKPFLEFLRDKVAPFIGGVLKTAFEGLSKAIGPVVDTITWILDKAAAVVGFFGDVGSFLFGGGGSSSKVVGAPALFGAAAGAGGGGRRMTAGSMFGGGSGGSGGGGVALGGDTYIITVQGA